jgi:tetratricopeptide (TPR) repeat protein
MIRFSPKQEPAQAAHTLTRLLEVEGIDDAVLGRVAGRLLDVHSDTQGRCSLASEEVLLVSLEACLGRLVARQPENPRYLERHSTSLMWLGNLRKDQGDIEGSIECFQRAKSIRDRLADAASVSGRPHEGSGGPSLNLGDALFAKGDLDGALAIYSHPAHAESSAAHCRIGNVLRQRNDLDGALASFRDGIEILNRELGEDPANQPAQMNLGIAFSAMGSTFFQKSEFGDALELYRAAERILAGLAARNPNEPHLQFEWSLMHLRIGQALLAMSEPQEARESLISGIPILERVVTRHPDNPNYLYHLALFDLPLGDLLFGEGDVDAALARWSSASKMLERLVAHDPENGHWRTSLDAALDRIHHATRMGGG